MIRTVRRIFVSMAAQMLAPLFATDLAGKQIKFDDRIDARAARGKRSALRLRNRSRYMPHDGGGQLRKHPLDMTDGDRQRLAAAAAKRVRKGVRLQLLCSAGAIA